MLSLLLASTLLLAQTDLEAPSGEVLNPAFEGLDERWRAAMKEFGVPGMAMAVVEGDTILHLQTFGVRDSERNLPVTPRTMFYIASATKPFVALAVMQLVEEGQVELDASVKEYLPRFVLADAEATRTLTVRDLLCHSQGLNHFPIVFLDAYSGQITEDRYYHFLAEVEPRGEIAYSNLHFTLLGRIVEARRQAPWKDVLRERIFAPAGMEDTTGYATWMYQQADVAIPTIRTADGFAPASVRKIDETMHAAGGLGTSARDGARWIEVQLNGGRVGERRLLSDAGLAEMLAPQSSFARKSGWPLQREGFGLGWNRGAYRGQRYFQHGGGYIGSASLFSFLPDAGLGIVVLANTDGPGHGLCELVTIDVYDFLLGDESGYDHLSGLRERLSGPQRPGDEPEGENPAGAASALTLAPQAYAGTYANEFWGELVLELDQGELRGHLGNVALSLHTRGAERFLVYSASALASEGSFGLGTGPQAGVESVTLDIEGRQVVFTR